MKPFVVPDLDKLGKIEGLSIQKHTVMSWDLLEKRDGFFATLRQEATDVEPNYHIVGMQRITTNMRDTPIGDARYHYWPVIGDFFVCVVEFTNADDQTLFEIWNA